MKLVRLLAFAPLTLTGACAALFPEYHTPDDTIVATQLAPDQVATCVAQSAGVAAVPMANGGFTLDVPSQPNPTRLTIFRDKRQTVVVGPADERAPDSVAQLAIGCVLKLTPPATKA